VFGRGRRSPVFGRSPRPSVVGAEARWCQSPRFNASLIGLRVRVCDGAAGTVNVGSRAPADPSFIWRCTRGAHCHERPALEQLDNHGQPVSNVGFQGVAWPQQGLHLPVTQQLHYHEETAANGGFPGPQNEVNMHAGQPPRDHQQPVPDSGFQGLTWPQQAVHSPAEQLHYHEQVAVNGFPPQTLFPGLSSEAMINPCPISHGGQNLWQQAGTLEQWRPAENANPLPSYSLSEPREEHYESTTVSKDNGGQS
jgi:hypothetical protein